MPDPVNTVAPVISGSLIRGGTLRCSTGTWTNNPTSFAYQWERQVLDSSGSTDPTNPGSDGFLGNDVFSNIIGATGSSYVLVSSDVGKEIRCTVIASNTAPASPWLGWTVPGVPGGATVIASGAALLAAFANPVDDAVYDATALTATFSDKVTISGRCTDGHPATFFLGDNVTFTQSAAQRDPAVDLAGAANLTIYGGDITNPTLGHGLIVRGSGGTAAKNITWWDFSIHDVAMNGLYVHQTNGNVQGCDFRGEIQHWCLVPALDSHTTKGTGLHGATIGVAGSGSVNSSLFVLHLHDSSNGGGVQLGPNLTTVEVQVQAERLTYNPPSGADGTGGNAIQIAGGSQSNLVVSFVQADTVRRGVDVQFLGTPSNPIQVTYGLVTNSRVFAYDTSKPSSSIQYTNVTPSIPITTPPPSSTPALLDLRATVFSFMPTSGLAGNCIPNIVVPAYQNSDMALAADATWGQVFYVGMNLSSKNPWRGASELPISGEIQYFRPFRAGEEVWYGQSITIVSGAGFLPANSGVGWAIFSQLAYTGVFSPPIGLEVRANGFGIDRNGGVYNPSAFPSTQTTPSAWARVEGIRPISDAMGGQYVDFMLRVVWTLTATGLIEVYTRVHGGSWSLDYNPTNTITAQANASGGFPTGVDEKQGGYFGNLSPYGPPTNPSFDFQYKLRGLSLHATRAQCEAALA